MTDYKATPEQWAQAEEHCEKTYGSSWMCLLELRARVEALEDSKWQQEVRWNSKPTPKDRQIRSSLVERVSKAIIEHGDGEWYIAEARAAIREVAQWLREQSPVMHRSGQHWAEVLGQEAER